jgi:hypothetical protein
MCRSSYVPIEANVGGQAQQETKTAPANVIRRKEPVVQKYSPDQPRVPAGYPESGQWTSERADVSTPAAAAVSIASGSRALHQSAQYAALDISSAGILSDGPSVFSISPEDLQPDIRFAGGGEDDENESRGGGRPLEGTEAQLARLDFALARWRSLFTRIQRLDPAWLPKPILVDPNTIEGSIAKLEAQAQEAEEHLARLRDLGFQRDPDTGRPIPPTAARTGNPVIDSMTDKLMEILGKVMDQIGPRPDLKPSAYGTLVHTEFAKAVRDEQLPGIDTGDVERTFGLEVGASYGAKFSVRPDVIFRDNDDIAAIYDVKTGSGLREDRVIRIRDMTGSSRLIPIIELNRARGSIVKRNSEIDRTAR